VLRFAALLVALYFAVAVRPVNDAVVVPFTGAVARASARLLRLSGERVRVAGTTISGPGFAVNVENGCNGVETVLLVAAAVLAFPAGWRERVAGIAAGFALIEGVNLVRVASLYWIGAHRPAWFGPAHTAVWQSAVVLIGVAFFLAWGRYVAKAPRASEGR
jgi:exosortase H (IPTLxxWG-CTERM-specific)